MNLRSQPVAVCSDCGHYSYDLKMIGQKCSQRSGFSRCSGTLEDYSADRDWLICKPCSGQGYINGTGCKSCNRSGWVPRR